MIPFLSAEPATRSPDAARAISEQTASATPDMPFGAFMEDAPALAVETVALPDDGLIPADGEVELTENALPTLRGSRDAPLPEVAPPQVRTGPEARPADVPVTAPRQGTAPQVPEKVALPARAAEVIASLTEGARPVPASPVNPVKDGQIVSERPAVTPPAPSMRSSDVSGVQGDEPSGPTPRRPQEDVVLPTRDLPQVTAGRNPRDKGQVPGLAVAQTAIGSQSSAPAGDTQRPLRDQPKDHKDHDAPPRMGLLDRSGEKPPVAPPPVSPIAAALHQQRGLLHPKDTVEGLVRTAEPLAGGFAPMSDRSVPHAQAAHAPAAAAASPEVARHVASQLAVAISQGTGRQTEISLNPEELGRVRMSISAADNSVSLTLLAERPETADLLRRHIDILAQEFRALGYADINFSFGDESAGQDAPENTAAEAATMANLTEEPQHSQAAALPQTAGVDLRL